MWTGRIFKCVYGLNQDDIFTVTSEPYNIDRKGTKVVDGISELNGEINIEIKELVSSIYWEEQRRKNMIYTSYFAKLKSLPDDIIPISICGKAPDWYTGLQYKKLAPKWDFFKVWKETHDNEYYIKCFNEQVLSKLNAKNVVSELSDIAGFNNRHKNICLICYEKPTDFCHRHLVADWLNKNGYRCKEYQFND